MMKKGATTAMVLVILAIGIIGAVLLYSGGSSPTGAVEVGTVCCLIDDTNLGAGAFTQVATGSCSGKVVHDSWCAFTYYFGDVTLCHLTGSSANPGVTIKVHATAAAAHAKHGDFYGPCPPTTTTTTVPSTTSTTSGGGSTTTTVTVPSTTSTTSGGGSTTTTTSGGGSTTTTETPSTTTTTTPTVTSTTTPPSTTSTTQPCANPNSCFGDLDCCPGVSCEAGTCVS